MNYNLNQVRFTMIKHYVSAVGFLLIVPVTALSQGSAPWSVGRTEFGHPDLQGNWEASTLTPLERAPTIQSLVISAEQAQEFAGVRLDNMPELLDPNYDITGALVMGTVNGEFRSSVITSTADGLMPFSAQGLELAARQAQRNISFDGPEQRPRWERCLGGLGSPPIRMFFDVIPHKIIQTRDHVLIFTEDQGGARIIYLNEAAKHITPPSWVGHSVGHWEDDSLVVETDNFQSIDPARGNIGRPLLIGEHSKVTERFTRSSATAILYQFTVEDPEFYTESWSGEFELNSLDGEIYEFACHEGNYALPGILRGGKVQ